MSDKKSRQSYFLICYQAWITLHDPRTTYSIYYLIQENYFSFVWILSSNIKHIFTLLGTQISNPTATWLFPTPPRSCARLQHGSKLIRFLAKHAKNRSRLHSRWFVMFTGRFEPNFCITTRTADSGHVLSWHKGEFLCVGVVPKKICWFLTGARR